MALALACQQAEHALGAESANKQSRSPSLTFFDLLLMQADFEPALPRASQILNAEGVLSLVVDQEAMDHHQAGNFVPSEQAYGLGFL